MEGNRAVQLAGVTISGFLVSLVVVCLRFWVRIKIVRKLGMDDWFALISFFLMLAAFGLLGSACTYGLGRHADTLSSDNVMQAMKLTWIAFDFTPLAEGTGKISVAFLLMRVTTSKYWYRFFVVLIALNLAINIGMTISVAMSCWPIEMLWDPSVLGHCNTLQRDIMGYIQCITCALSDLVLAVAPIMLLWHVRISRRSKWLLCGLLSIGFFTAAVGFVRLGYMWETYSAATSVDPTSGIMDFIIWKCLEIGLSIIVGCLPTLRPLFDGESTQRKWHRAYNDNYYNNNYKGMKIYKLNEIQVQWSPPTKLTDLPVTKVPRESIAEAS